MTKEGDATNDDDLKSRKRKERLEQNRISARESRKRKKTMIEELQRTVIKLSRENKDLNEKNEGFRRNLMEIGIKYPGVVPIQAIIAGTPNPQSAFIDPQNAGPANSVATAFPNVPIMGVWPSTQSPSNVNSKTPAAPA
mmetsp:Transcript_17505/g.24697  ORF Transcript_17505/g.24697 Transcript_17505/m.24697 type:complete len:139 (+) Transcript_17505:126-542(+)|eukprot:CAMPEP_0184855014 /NCGR_PEP_ID=MMETSP0580-20130426/363_1 /TAXON_ID=1118495 /ORGANISM="Dactyliosolen fragilissimus" /LENGTH=138 /DNA_ID=CAMNT_0027349421 /DNA_START=54 /DNA_END=470 /DNA_ORIENTATION=+